MIQYLAAYAAVTVTMLAIDMLWLGVIAKSFYQRGIGHLMADEPNLFAAGVFYLLFPLGIMIFAVISTAASDSWTRTILTGALFGFFAYATYDLTNLATLKNWPLSLSLVDTAWGTLVSGIAAAAGKAAWDYFAKG
jgi:uncharacterized membrane protein